MFDILIADDDKNWRELAEETFSIAGYLCDFAFDGQQAIKKLETEKYKLVCINWKLRDYQHGRALLRRLHSQYPEIPVILTTGYPEFTAGSWDDASKKFSQDIENLRARYSNLKKIIIKGKSEAGGREFIDILLDEAQHWIDLKPKNEQGKYFDVFLCHNSEDKARVKIVGEKLKREGIVPWLDEWELQPGLPWQRVLEDQIENIKSAAVFVGSNGIGPWQKMELEGFLREFVEREISCPVIPVILPGCEAPPRLPPFLRGMTWVDFREVEPDPIEQLIWGITGRRGNS